METTSEGRDLLERELARAALRRSEAQHHASAERIAQAAGWNYQRSRDAYHELALIDAHVDGVKINVEQPLEVGQKIEVHAPEQQ